MDRDHADIHRNSGMLASLMTRTIGNILACRHAFLIVHLSRVDPLVSP